MATTVVRMPLLSQVVPAALELAHLVDAAGGIDAAARLLDTDPGHIAGWLTGTPTGTLPLVTRRLARYLGERAGWSTPAPVLRAVS